MSKLPAPLGESDHHTGALTHIDEFGQARMIDVTAKPVTRRIAIARCVVLTAADAPPLFWHCAEEASMSSRRRDSPACRQRSRQPRSSLFATPSTSIG